MSNQGTTELSADLESRTRVQPSSNYTESVINKIDTTPTRLSPISKRKKDISSLVKYYFPRLASQHKAITGVNKELDMSDISLTNLETLAKNGTRQSKVVNVILTEGIDKLGDGARKFFLVYHTSETGKDKRGQELPSADRVYGLDMQYEIKERYDEDGEPLEPELGQTYEVLTTPYEKEILEKVCAGRDTSSIQFSVSTMSSRSYGGYTYEEFLEFGENNIKELLERATLGRQGSDTSILFSSLSTKEKLFLQQNQLKK